MPPQPETIMKLASIAFASIVSVTMLSSCVGPAGQNTVNGAAAGALLGGGAGAIIGHNSHGRTASGALIGAGTGALIGGALGNQQDERNRQYEQRSDGYYDEDGNFHRKHHRADGYYDQYGNFHYYR
jgi:uncharacterized protein YcfJ